jgi:N-acetyl-anhydromuramyl-L-alanine amidase AmpD
VDVIWQASPNYAPAARAIGDVRSIVLHDTECSLAVALQIFGTPGGTSAHYLIDADGMTYQTVAEASVAYHAAAFGGDPSLNRNRPVWLPPYNGRYSATNAATVGIEIVGYAAQGYTAAQYRTLGRLCREICARWRLTPRLLPDHGADATIVTHAWLQTNRGDPGPLFDWAAFRAALDAGAPGAPGATGDPGQGSQGSLGSQPTTAALTDGERAILDVMRGLHADAGSIAGWINQIGALEQVTADLTRQLEAAQAAQAARERRVTHVTLAYDDGTQQLFPAP